VSQQEHVHFPNVQNPVIKTENQRYDQPAMSSYPQVPMNGYSGGFNSDLAQQRAMTNIAQRYGQGPHNMQAPAQQHGQAPMHPQQRMIPGQAQGQRPQQPPQVQQQVQQQRPPHNHIYTSQTDGADGALEDWKALVQARAAAGDGGPEGRLAADKLMSTRIAAMAAETDTGLGMTLSQMPKGMKRKAITRVRQAQQAEASSSSSAVPKVNNFDGDDEENDEDAINSDLDDPEDENGAGEDDDDDMLDYMLCTYDKVQRVKNKWKCTLKDGILTTNKKE
jgi:transcription initiation factor TFIIA large subunit